MCATWRRTERELIVADDDAVRSRRKRAHANGDHSGCGGRLRVATDGDVSALRAAVEAEFAADDVLVLALASRLAEVAAEGHGPAAVAARRGSS
jgi:hypothetical protein